MTSARDEFKPGDIRLRIVLGFEAVSFPARLIERSTKRFGIPEWTYEDLSTGEIKGPVNEQMFSLGTLNEMEVIALVSR